jgi:hypothetical protein
MRHHLRVGAAIMIAPMASMTTLDPTLDLDLIVGFGETSERTGVTISSYLSTML